jgi:hypothetical protein
VLLVAASAALAAGAWGPAADGYRRALAAARDRRERADAAGGLARAAHRAGEAASVATALATLARDDDRDAALLRRFAAAVAPRGGPLR